MKTGIEKSNSCEGKTKYASLLMANNAIKQLNRKTNNRVVSYKCFFCDGFHFGHESRKAKRIDKFKRDKKKLDPKEYITNQSALNEGYCLIKKAG